MVLWKIITSIIALSVVLALATVLESYLSDSKTKPNLTITAEKKLAIAQEKHEKKQLAAFKEYKKKVAKVWGKEAIVPDAKRDVTYRDNYKQRSIVDYDEGLVKVELALKPDNAKNSKSMHRQLMTAVEETVNQTPDDRSIIEIAKNPTPPSNKRPAVLAGLVANIDDSPLSPEELTQALDLVLN